MIDCCPPEEGGENTGDFILWCPLQQSQKNSSKTSWQTMTLRFSKPPQPFCLSFFCCSLRKKMILFPFLSVCLILSTCKVTVGKQQSNCFRAAVLDHVHQNNFTIDQRERNVELNWKVYENAASIAKANVSCLCCLSILIQLTSTGCWHHCFPREWSSVPFGQTWCDVEGQWDHSEC